MRHFRAHSTELNRDLKLKWWKLISQFLLHFQESISFSKIKDFGIEIISRHSWDLVVKTCWNMYVNCINQEYEVLRKMEEKLWTCESMKRNLEWDSVVKTYRNMIVNFTDTKECSTDLEMREPDKFYCHKIDTKNMKKSQKW